MGQTENSEKSRGQCHAKLGVTYMLAGAEHPLDERGAHFFGKPGMGVQPTDTLS